MDQDFSAGLGQCGGWVESADVTEMEDRRPGSGLEVGCKYEGAVHDDAEAPDLGGEENRDVLSMTMGKAELVGGSGFEAHEQGISFICR